VRLVQALHDFDDMQRPCAKAARLLGPDACHRSDNRHRPTGDPCRCGRRAAEHRVAHEPKGDPCARYKLPASSHVWRERITSPKLIQSLIARDGRLCQLCKKPFDDPPPAHPHPLSIQIDHKDPRWESRSDEFENLQLAHRRCNMRKGGGPEKSPNQQVVHIRALLPNILVVMAGDPPRCLEFLSGALAKLDPLFLFLGKASDALAILDETLDRLHALQAPLGHTYLPLIATCQSKRAEILDRLGRSDDASFAAGAANEILAKAYLASLAPPGDNKR
jgi:5-methylcytosine-specific restriction endonuclease McrA